MDIKSTEEIFATFLGLYNFNNIYAQRNFPVEVATDLGHMAVDEAVEFLMTSSVTGGKSIGFFHQMPRVVPKTLRNSFIIVASELSVDIDVPVMYCKSIDDMPEILEAANRISLEAKVPIGVTISDDIRWNYSDSQFQNDGFEKISPYISKNTMESADEVNFDAAHSILKSYFGETKFCGDVISFNDVKGEFFKFLTPCTDVNRSICKTLPKKMKVLEGEETFFQSVVPEWKSHSFEKYQNSKGVVYERKMCPGCPFVSLMNRIDTDDLLVFSDVECEALLSLFNVHKASIATYLGLTCSKPNVKTLFVGNASSYSHKFEKMIENGNIILLEDIRVDSKLFRRINHPRQLNDLKNFIFGYSCQNIKSYKTKSVKEKKCLCGARDEPLHCIQKTACPALHVVQGTVKINKNICTGCDACKVVCPYGAVV